MAMRPRGGRAYPSRPSRLIIGRVYEQFRPMSEWRQEDDHDTLLVYLPGFQKDYIKVTTENKNIVRVRGERLVAENKWSRFQEDFQVPENCEMSGIQAMFDGGIVTITMPRKIVTAPASTASQVAPKAEEQPFRRTKQEEAPLKPKGESKEKPTSSTAAHKSRKKPDKPQTPPEGSLLPPQPMPTSSSRPTKKEPLKTAPEAKEVDGKLPSESLSTSDPKREKPTSSTAALESRKEPDKPQTPLEGSLWPPQPMPTSSSRPTKQEPLKTAPEAKEVDEKLPSESLSTSDPKKDKHEFFQNPNDQGEIRQKGVTGKTRLVEGKEKEAQLEEKTKRDSEKDARATSSGFRSDKLEEYKKAVKGLARGEMNEERELLVNMGVAVLVIVALGVHVAFTIGSIGKGK